MIDVIALAREAGAAELIEKPHFVESRWRLNGDALERFARLVAEECAKACDDLTIAVDHGGNKYHRPAHAGHCATAIRAKFAAKEGGEG